MGGPLSQLFTWELGLLAGIVVAAVGIQTAIGFGAMLVAVTVGASLWSVPELTAMLIPLTWLQTCFILLRHHREVAWRLLGTRALPFMGLGLGISLVMVGAEEQGWMRPTLGVMVLVLALRELFGAAPRAGGSRIAGNVGLVVAGLVHGVFTTGGPPLVWSLGQEGLAKAAFRVTLTAVFATINTVMIATFVARGQIDAESALRTAVLAVPMALGIAIGEWLHHRVDEQRFRLAVWAFLAVAAIPLIAPTVLRAFG